MKRKTQILKWIGTIIIILIIGSSIIYNNKKIKMERQSEYVLEIAKKIDSLKNNTYE